MNECDEVINIFITGAGQALITTTGIFVYTSFSGNVKEANVRPDNIVQDEEVLQPHAVFADSEGNKD